MADPKLTIEMVPQSSWGDNLRSRLKAQDWDRVRKGEYRRAGYVCEICGESGLKQGERWPTECHEIWEYREDHVQELKCLIVLCPRCHHSKHFGRAEMVGQRAQAIQQLMKVNQWTSSQAEDHVAQAKLQWQERSRFKWALDISWLERTLGVKPV